MTHYYDEHQDSPLRITRIERTCRGNRLKFETGSGVFSVGTLDKGSALLIEKCDVPVDGEVLDLGCGYGAVGVALGKAFPDMKILCTDINKRAVNLARSNAQLNKVMNIKFKQGDGYAKVEGLFDVVLLNPPQSAGKKLCLSLMRDAAGFLKKGGSLQVVMRHNVGGKDMSEKVMDTYSTCEHVAIKSGFRVYKFLV